MTSVPQSAPAEKPSWAETLAVYARRRVLVVLFLGFSAGLPLALSGSTLLRWMAEAGVDLRTIGLFALVGTPYTVKFLWAPLVDALDLPVLSRLLGRRRAWLVLTQVVLMAAVVFLGLCDPATDPWLVALGALMVAIASATQDIVIDAFRVESLDENEQAAGMASYVAGYRIGMLASMAGALFLVSAFERLELSPHAAWTAGYMAMAALGVIGIITSLVATEPQKSAPVEKAHTRQNPVARVIATAIGAFADFRRHQQVIAILAFVVLFKFTDALAGVMTAPFVYELGFSRDVYAAIIKGVGLAATLIGGFAGGFVARAYPLSASLWIGGILQAVANLAFSWQADGRRGCCLAHLRDRGGEFHQRHRHGDLRGLPVGAVPEPAAHRDPICVADRARCGRTDLSVVRRRFHRVRCRLGGVLRDLRRRGDTEPCAAGVAATERTFQDARDKIKS